MNKFYLVLFLFSTSIWAKTFVLDHGTATYTVKHLVKTIHGTSKNLKGKIECNNTQCEFLIAVKVNTFTSSDSNRDLNMQATVESSQFPLAVL